MLGEATAPRSPIGDWCLDRALLHLNHGAFGALPRLVREVQDQFRDRVEAEPMVWYDRHHLPAMDRSRTVLATCLGVPENTLALVPNTTTGINGILASCTVSPGDEWLCTDHTYNATRNALHRWATARGASVRVVALPFPVSEAGAWEQILLDAVGPATRLMLLDHVSSGTGAVLDVARLVPVLEGRGVRVLLDTAHGAGMLDVSPLESGASWTVGNGHKWLFGAKGSGFVHVRSDLISTSQPLVTSHGWNASDGERGRFRWMSDWLGTLDYTAMYVLPEAIAFADGLHALGTAGHRQALLEQARRWTHRLAEAMGQVPPLPDAMLGAMAVVCLPDAAAPAPEVPRDPLIQALRDHHGIVAGVFNWPSWPRRVLRVSAQAYLPEDAPERLLEALRDLGAC
ncbi:MAG: aminotransferase class V-fold PLP-dependent enzyme [Candidatus Sericytochromatia bacterium]|nr:aminotransferase class V-fold PLP-dependent enzyme [Candidatus Sericytochromatia bacterium]